MDIFFYIAAIVLTIISFIINKDKTIIALKKGWKSFEGILPTVLSVMIVVGIILSIVNEDFIAKVMGPETGIIGMLLSVLLGAITMMAGFIAFPLGATLILNGAGIAQIGAFISSLMLVGILTIPLESKFFGLKTTVKRNLLGAIVSLFVGIALEVLL